MEKIASFQVDHTRLTPGMYTSRTDGDVVTYDVRFIKPNTPPYLDPPVLHTIEHLVATYVRNSSHKDGVIYFGPMGCQTGFYFLVRDMKPLDAIALVQESMAFIAAYEGEIPGASRIECGNYLLHDLAGAKQLAASMIPVLEGWKEENLIYEK